MIENREPLKELLSIPSPEGNRALLPSHLHSVYDRVSLGISRFERRIDLGKKVGKSDISKIVDAVTLDHPAYYWLGSGHTIGTSIGGTSMMPRYNMDRTDAEDMAEEVMNTVHLVDRAIERTSNDRLSVILSVHDHLCRNIEYDLDAEHLHSVIGAVRGSCVCDGVSKITSLMLNYARIRTDVVCGRLRYSTSGDMHAWNLCYGKHIDVTSDIYDDGFPSHRFFLRGSSMRATHEWEGWTTSNKDFEYHRLMGLVVDDDNDLRNILSHMKGNRLELKLSPNMSKDDCVRLILEHTGKNSMRYCYHQDDGTILINLAG